MTVRAVAAALGVVVALAGCADGSASTATTTTTPSTSTTTTAPPIVLGTARALDLEVGQCYAPVPARQEPSEPAPTTTAATSAPTSDPGATEGSTQTVPTTVAPTTTAVPPVLVADCAGTHLAQVFAAFCLVTGAERVLEAGACPGPADEPWPGDREVRRAATRVCLEAFEQHFGEPYATSRRSTTELTPTEGAWRAGDHRVVCAASEPEPDPAAPSGGG